MSLLLFGKNPWHEVKSEATDLSRCHIFFQKNRSDGDLFHAKVSKPGVRSWQTTHWSLSFFRVAEVLVRWILVDSFQGCLLIFVSKFRVICWFLVPTASIPEIFLGVWQFPLLKKHIEKQRIEGKELANRSQVYEGVITCPSVVILESISFFSINQYFASHVAFLFPKWANYSSLWWSIMSYKLEFH